MIAPVLPSRLYLIDTSAFARTHHQPVSEVIAGLVENRAAATCATVDLELGYAARDEAELRSTIAMRRLRFVQLSINDLIVERAKEVQLRMAARGHHRAAGAIDQLTAAVAAYHGAVVLHYDADFEHIAAITGQPHMWIAPRGSLV